MVDDATYLGRIEFTFSEGSQVYSFQAPIFSSQADADAAINPTPVHTFTFSAD